MTGANRLLIGFGWAAVAGVCYLRTGSRVVKLGEEVGTELLFLALATAYSFLIPLKGTLGMEDAGVLIGLFCAYVFFAARAKHVAPELEGPAEMLAGLPVTSRRFVAAALFAMAAASIFSAAKPFAEGLLAVGRRWGVDEFILVQWIAPIASEAPEFAVAVVFALAGRGSAGMGTLISSKVNQWTLLIGALPVAYALSGGTLAAMPLDRRQVEEIFLTAAQSVLAVVVIVDFRFSLGEALAIAVLFVLQLMIPNEQVRLWFAFAYLLLAVLMVVLRPRTLRAFAALWSAGLRLGKERA
jgi:cation:H+ antiporter